MAKKSGVCLPIPIGTMNNLEAHFITFAFLFNKKGHIIRGVGIFEHPNMSIDTLTEIGIEER